MRLSRVQGPPRDDRPITPLLPTKQVDRQIETLHAKFNSMINNPENIKCAAHLASLARTALPRSAALTCFDHA